MHRALAKNYEDAIKCTREKEAYWKAKYESWRYEIPDRIKQNLRTVKMIDRYWDDKRAAEKKARQADEQAFQSMKKARQFEWQLKFLRRNLEAKMEAMDIPHGFACLQTSL